jgi:hypothetical protein
MSTLRFSSITKITKIAMVGSSFAVLATTAACGSSDKTSSPQQPSTTPTTTTEAQPVPNHEVVPCGDIHSGYAGDAFCIMAPAPDQGFQFHYGPADYNNPAEVKNYVLQPNQEVTDCVYFMTPNTTDVYFNGYHSRMRPGSHHMLLYIQSTPVTETGPTDPPGNCSLAGQLQSSNLFGAQTPQLDVNGNIDGAPENNGVAVRIPAMQQGIMQVHFINAGTKPILREAWANVMYVDKSQVTQLAEPIFFIAGVTMSIMKGQTVTIHGTAPVPSGAGPGFRLVQATPHYHTHTDHFAMYATIGGTQTKILETFPVLHTLPEPALTLFDSVMKNPVPNPSTKTGGASSGMLNLKPGDKIDWECEVVNDDQPNPITFANAVYTGEMCNVFGSYAPSTGTPWQAPNL